MQDDRKVFAYAMFLALSMILALTVYLIWQWVQESNYVEVEATVKDVYVTYGATSRKPCRKVTYAFTYEGNRYTATRQTLFERSGDEGKVVTIKCNPENPEELQDVYGAVTSVFVLIVLCIGFVLMARTWRKDSL